MHIMYSHFDIDTLPMKKIYIRILFVSTTPYLPKQLLRNTWVLLAVVDGFLLMAILIDT